MQHNEQETELEKGDICRWFKQHGTITFVRDSKHMRIGDGKDDKHYIQSISFIQFMTIVQILSEATGMKVIIHQDNEQFADYKFI
jgi:hypothetical protein